MSKAKPTSVFFATSFSGHINYETGRVNDDFRGRVEDILNSLRHVGGFSVTCAVESENWRVSSLPPGDSMAGNFANIESHDVFLALVDRVGSDGRGIEVEHAYNAGKQVILATGPGEEPGWVLKDILALGRAEHVPYSDAVNLALRVKELVTVS